MTQQIIRAYKFRAFPPKEGIAAFEFAVSLKSEMWAKLCAMQAEFQENLDVLLAPPKAERDEKAIYDLKSGRYARMKEIRQEAAAKGLSSGDYNSTIFQFESACASARRRRAIPTIKDDAMGECVTQQILNLPFEKLRNLNSLAMQLLPKNEKEKRRKPGGKRAEYRPMRLYFRLRSDRNPAGEAVMPIDFCLHRMPPPHAVIAEVRVLRRQRELMNKNGDCYTRFDWFVIFVVKSEVEQKASGKDIGVALKWGVSDDDEAALCRIADGSGKERMITFPPEHLEKWRWLREEKTRLGAEDVSVRIKYKKAARERDILLRGLAKEIAESARSVAVPKTYLSGLGTKGYVAPATFLEFLKQACAARGVTFSKIKLEDVPPEKRAEFLQKAAKSAFFSAGENDISEQKQEVA